MIRKLALLTVALVLCFSPVGTFAQDDPPSVILPELTGPFQVGRAEYHLIDNSREEFFTEEPGDVREIFLTVYYPAEPAPDAEPALFFANDAVRAYFASAYVPGVLDDFYSHSYLNAPITGSNYPVLLFSPGLPGTPLGYTTKLEELASHGYIIIGIWYPYSAPIVVFPDGRLAEGNSAGQGTDMADMREIIEVWCEDTAFVIDQLEMLNQNDSLLANVMDLSRMGIFGHSAGGATAIYMLQRNENLVAGASLDYAPFDDIDDHELHQPALFWVAYNRFLPKNVLLQWVNHGYLLKLRNSEHVTFSDMPFLAPMLTIDFPPVGTIDAHRATAVISAYLLAFFDTYLKGETSSLLDGPSADYEDVLFTLIE